MIRMKTYLNLLLAALFCLILLGCGDKKKQVETEDTELNNEEEYKQVDPPDPIKTKTEVSVSLPEEVTQEQEDTEEEAPEEEPAYVKVNPEVQTVLDKYNFKANEKTVLGKATVLHEAAEEGDVAAVRTLIEVGGMDVDTVDGDGWTPLHYAADQKKLEVVTYLVEKGADVNALTNDELTPLDLVTFLESYKSEEKERVASYLVEHGAKASGNHNSLVFSIFKTF